MDWPFITKYALQGTIAAALIAIAAGQWQDDPSGMQAMAGITERVLLQNGRLMAEQRDRARKDRAALTATQELLRDAQAELAVMKASLAAQIKAPVQTVDAVPARMRKRGR